MLKSQKPARPILTQYMSYPLFFPESLSNRHKIVPAGQGGRRVKTVAGCIERGDVGNNISWRLIGHNK